jgi:hypothetical protein
MLLAYFFIQFIEVTIIGVLSRDESGPLRLRDEIAANATRCSQNRHPPTKIHHGSFLAAASGTK